MKTLLASPSLAARSLAQSLQRDANGIARAGRRLLAVVALTVAGLSLHAVGAVAEPGSSDEHWVGTWGAAAGAPLPAQLLAFSDQTVRLIVHTSAGGSRVRIRLSNENGTMPLHVGSVHIARRQNGAIIMTGTDRAFTFGGAQEVTIAPGAAVLSDAVALDVPASADLAVSLYLPGQVQANTGHATAFQSNYVSLPGNFASAQALPTDHTITSWPFLAEVDVEAPGDSSAARIE